jgi:D-aspartate ligase
MSAPPHVVVLDPFSAGLALARRLVRAGGRVTVVVEPSEPEVSRSRGVESVIASFGDDGGAWLSALRRLVVPGEPMLVLPATDRGSDLLVRAGADLPDEILAFERGSEAHTALMDKERADAIARRAGVDVPWTVQLDSVEDLSHVAPEAPWPCVVKPVLSHEWRARYSHERVFLVRDSEEAARRLSRPLEDGVAMLLCQYVVGEDSDVEEAIVVRLADGSYPLHFGCRKLRQWPAGFGMTAVGESSLLPETTEIARRVLDEAGFVGVAGVEVKRDARTGERWFIEVNVRMPGQWGLGDACGADASMRLVAALSGRSQGSQPELKPGVRMVLPDLDAHVVVPALRAAPLRRRPALTWRLLRPYFGAREWGMCDPRDPGPGLALARKSVRGRVARLRGRTPA